MVMYLICWQKNEFTKRVQKEDSSDGVEWGEEVLDWFVALKHFSPDVERIVTIVSQQVGMDLSALGTNDKKDVTCFSASFATHTHTHNSREVVNRDESKQQKTHNSDNHLLLPHISQKLPPQSNTTQQVRQGEEDGKRDEIEYLRKMNVHLMMSLVAHDDGAVPDEKEGKGQPDDHIRPER